MRTSAVRTKSPTKRLRVSRAFPVFLLLAVLQPACKVKVNPPFKPTKPTGVTTGGISIAYGFSTTTTDIKLYDIAFRFCWGDGDTSDWSDWVASGETAAMLRTWDSAGTYNVKAQAKNWYGAGSEWSDALVVTITANRPPDTPGTPGGPSDGEIGISYQFTATTADPDTDNIAIRFCWGGGDTSSWSNWVASGETVVTTRKWMNQGEYDVMAQAKDVSGMTSGWSAAHRVTITSAPSDTVKWRYQPAGQTWVTTSPAVEPGGVIYLGVVDLFALNPDGTQKWRYPTDGEVNSSPSVGADGTVYVGSDDGYLYAVNPDGTLKWRCNVGRVRNSPSVEADGTVYVVPDGLLGLYAIDASGSFKWSYRFWGTTSSPAIAGDGTVYVGSDDDYLYAFNPDGTLRWRYQTGGDVASSPAIGSDGTVYVGSADGYLYAVNPDSTLKWRYQAGAFVSSPAVAADGTVYVGSRDSYFYALNPDGTQKWRYGTGWELRMSSPAIAADGTVYIGSCDFYLYAFHGDSPLANTPWPKYKCSNLNTGRVGGR